METSSHSASNLAHTRLYHHAAPVLQQPELCIDVEIMTNIKGGGEGEVKPLLVPLKGPEGLQHVHIIIEKGKEL